MNLMGSPRLETTELAEERANREEKGNSTRKSCMYEISEGQEGEMTQVDYKIGFVYCFTNCGS